jgi:hypothetical protein
METFVPPTEDTDQSTYAEELLTSPALPPYAARARDQLLDHYYDDGLGSRDMYDIVSLTASQFRPQLEELAADLPSVYTTRRKTAGALFAASTALAAFLDLDLRTAIDEQRHSTMYGRSSLDGVANLAVMVGAGLFDNPK